MGRLDNKAALITGAGSGIGKATAKLFAKEGAKVVVADINENTGLEVVEQIKENGGKGIFVHVDLERSADVLRMVNEAMDSYGRLDILFNNAGFLSESMDEITEKKWRRAIDVMLTAPFLACKYAIPIMRKQGSGNILNTGSIGSLNAGGGKSIAYNIERMSPAYTAAKGGILMLTRHLARILAKDNIRVNCICPGSVNTGIRASRRAYLHIEEERSEVEADRIAHIPMKRIAEPEEIASVALFLASDESSFVTGIALVADGGVLA